MPITDLRQTVLEVVNIVERKMGISPSASLNATPFTQMLLDLLNEVVADLAEDGERKELYFSTIVTAQSSVSDYAVDPAGGLVHHIYEVSQSARGVAPLTPVNLSEINLLNRTNSFGVSNQYHIVSANSSGQPVARVFPTPGANENNDLFTFVGFLKPPLYTTSDGAIVPVFPANVLWRGLHAYALLEENGGEPTREYQMALAMYEKAKQQDLNRFTTDYGPTVQFMPDRRRRR
ncbi:MAG: hypothetical protein ACR2O4_02955 [Hyphomicrobiaceae bacterium]